MKKNNLFKAVGIVILVYVLLSWIIPIVYSIGGFKGEVSNQIGFVSLTSILLETFSGFGSVILYVLLVGAFYGVLKVTGAYDRMLNTLIEKTSGKEKIALISIIVIMALISSVAGLDLGLIILFPLLIELVVKMGYDKFVALSSTVGATIIGMYGSTLSGTMYGANHKILGLEKYDQIIPKVALFVLGLAALITFVILYVKKAGLNKAVKVSKTKDVKKDAKKESKEKVKKVASKKKESKAVNENKASGACGAFIILGIVLLVIFLGTVAWDDIFKSNWFATAHTSWTGVKVGEFPILAKLFGGLNAFGTWLEPTRFQTYGLLLVFAMIALKFVYKTNLKDVFEGFVEGIKEFVVPALLTLLACSVFVLVYYNPFLSVVTKNLLTKDFNVALAGIYTIINSVFYVDYYYVAYASLYGLIDVFKDKTVLSILSVMYVNLYSLVMLIAPTSVLLLISLYISDIKYTEWFKFIWKLVLTLFLISFIVFVIMLIA